MKRRPIDYTAQMQATEERRRLQEQKQRDEAQREQKLRERQASSYGQAVLEFFGPRMTIDGLAGLLLDCRERVQANAQLETEWAARGKAYFQPAGNDRRKQAAGAKSKPSDGHESPKASAPQPASPRPSSPQGAPDLLGGLAAHLPGSGAPGEGGGDDGHS
jgi:hypothetical protein